eukprot:TRINITY_DN40086_c0_g1_i1.p3 TRINITY_DN40086_c0_g1~~TRINITY_DN40086_c0_g1_i1.p3  ORF type:complete len:168 (+),score=37.55 TRINITY_DN40086_c0_g1_i1:52-555(+)
MDGLDGYAPTKQEVEEYAAYLGIAPEEQDLLWVAEMGLQAPLPAPWAPVHTDGGYYYVNKETRTTTWTHPCDSYFKEILEQARRGRSSPRAAQQCTKLVVRGGSREEVQLRVRICASTTFAGVLAELPQQPGQWRLVDGDGFVFPSGDRVREHFGEEEGTVYAQSMS